MKSPLCKVEDISPEGTTMVDFFGREVMVFENAGEFKAVLNYCMHLGGPMEREGDKLVCQWHGAEFDCSGGQCLKGPARLDTKLITLPTRVENGVLLYVFGE